MIACKVVVGDIESVASQHRMVVYSPDDSGDEDKGRAKVSSERLWVVRRCSQRTGQLQKSDQGDG